MPIPVTSWRNYVDPGITGLINGEPYPWQYGSDDAVPVGFDDILDSGESLSSPTPMLRRIPAHGTDENDYTAADDKITATTVSGATVLVRLTGLERGRFYKLDVVVGAAGNRRGGNTIIRVSG